ncbi:M4 family metallopeptidase [Clostridiaceae bacterium M8S5]|nr:M4 family metallopeptidase [Clostridiaceae bacterium M8S5]
MSKKFLIIMVIVSMLLQTVTVNALSHNTERFTNSKPEEVLEKFEESNFYKSNFSSNLKVIWDKNKNIPSFIKNIKLKDIITSEKQAIEFIKRYKGIFNISYSDFNIRSIIKDDLNMTHYKVIQEIDGIPVYGQELIIHTDSNNNIYALNGSLEPDNNIGNIKWSKAIKTSDSDSISSAKRFLNIESIDSKLISKPDTQKYLYEFEGKWYVVNLVTLQFNKPYPANYKIFVDLASGTVIDSYNAIADTHIICTGINGNNETVSLNADEQNGYYYLRDITRNATIETYSLDNDLYAPQPGEIIKNTIGTFNKDHYAVDAHYNLGKVYDYFYETFGRKSFDNRDGKIVSSVHFVYRDNSGKINKNNAMWNGRHILFGDGDGVLAGSHSRSLDIVAHEFTHGVTQYTANLIYRNQSGAVNESISDVFGVLSQGPTEKWWLLGDDVYTPNTPGDSIRNMKNPGSDSVYKPQPGHMDDYEHTNEDNGGVHINSGIPNRAFYLIANSIGFEKAGKIYYRALTTYLYPSSKFKNLRNALLQSTSDFYGESGNEYNVVKQAFDTVGIVN